MPWRRRCVAPWESLWREGESEGERRDSAKDMGTSPTSYLVVARGIKLRYYYQLSSVRFYTPRYYYGICPGGHGRDRLVVARVKTRAAAINLVVARFKNLRYW